MKHATLLNRINAGKGFPGTSYLLRSYMHTDRSVKQAYVIENQKSNVKEIHFLEQHIAALEGGTAAFSLKSFSAAKKLIFGTFLKPGDNILVHNSVKFSQNEYAKLSRAGIEIRVMKNDELYSFTELLNDRTKMIYIETIDSETLEVVNLVKIASYAKLYKIPLVADNTLGAAGYFTRPIIHGANIIITSTKRWLHSYRGVVGALIIDGGNYDWTNECHNYKFDSYYSVRKNSSIPYDEQEFSLIHMLRSKANTDYSRYPVLNNPLELIMDIRSIHSSAKIQTKRTKELIQWMLQSDYVGEVLYAGLNNSGSTKYTSPFLKNGFGYDIAFSFFNASLNKDFVNEVKLSEYKEFVDYSEVKNCVKVHIPAFKSEEFASVLKEKIHLYSNKERFNNRYLQLNSLSESF